jgi:LPXTG-motif cell wall-anchored protein
MMVRTLFMSAALMLAANVASAQITTYIAPPRPLAPSPLAVATADSAKKDSVAQANITNMKAWVDSAAGVTVPAHVGVIDSTALVNDPGRPVTTFSDGSVAPATASDLPTLAIAGILGLTLGAVLLRNRQRD